MVFDAKGGFYFTDFKDYTDASNIATGAVYYVISGLQDRLRPY